MYAASSLNDALQLTKRYLSALWLDQWLKLGAVLLFLGGLGIALHVLSIAAQLGVQAIEEQGAELISLEGDELVLVAGVAAGVLAIYAAFRYVAALLEFVFVESLRSESMFVRRYLRRNLRRGLWLLLFRFVLGVGAVVAIAAPIAAVIVFGDVTDPNEFSSGVVTAFVGYVLLVSLCWVAVNNLTNGFVVPIMLHDDRGPIGAWRRFVSVIGANWVGVGAFLFVAWTLGFMLWAFFAVFGIFAAFFGLFLWAFFVVLLTAVHDSLFLLALVGLLAGYLAYQYVVALVESPVRSYVRYYAIAILGASDPSLDLVADRRAAIDAGIRAGGAPEAMRPRSDFERADYQIVEDPGVEPTTGDASGESTGKAFDDPVWDQLSEPQTEDSDSSSRPTDDASEPMQPADEPVTDNDSSDSDPDENLSEVDETADQKADDSN